MSYMIRACALRTARTCQSVNKTSACAYAKSAMYSVLEPCPGVRMRWWYATNPQAAGVKAVHELNAPLGQPGRSRRARTSVERTLEQSDDGARDVQAQRATLCVLDRAHGLTHTMLVVQGKAQRCLSTASSPANTATETDETEPTDNFSARWRGNEHYRGV